MAFSKKINNTRVQISGIAGSASELLYDNTTSGLTANNVQDAVDQLNQHLTELERRGAMPNLDYANAVRISANTSYTVPSDGIIFVADTNAGSAITITINGKVIGTVNYSSGLFSFSQQYPVRSGDIFSSNRNNAAFVPLRS